MTKQTDALAARDREIERLQRDNERLRREVERLDRRAFDLISLLQASKAFDNLLEGGELYRVFASIVHERFGLKSYALFAMDDQRQKFQLVAQHNLPPELPADFSFPRQEGLLWQAILQGRPFSVVDAQGRARFRVPFEKYDLEALGARVFLPLVHLGQALGLLALGRKEDDTEFTDEDLEFLAVLASQAAVSVHTTLLYEKNERDRTELDRTVKNLSMLYNIGRMMIHISDLKNLLRFILGEAVKTTESQKGSLMLYDPALQRLVVRVVKGLPDARLEEGINNGEIECATFAPGEGVAGRVFQTQQPIIANATDKDDRYESRQGSNVDSILCVPLIASDEPIGVINITNKQSGQKFGTEDVDLLTALANQAAVAINNATLYEMAITDELTKLFVRRYFNIRLDAELKRARRYGGKLSIAICDLDRFKSVNDGFGHQVGDSVLARVAGLLKNGVREIDTPARYGGEEFAVILPETDLSGAQVMAERLRETVSKTTVEGLPRNVTISIGLACYPDHAEDKAALVRAADTALYEAKRSGRNRVCVYSVPKAATEG